MAVNLNRFKVVAEGIILFDVYYLTHTFININKVAIFCYILEWSKDLLYSHITFRATETTSHSNKLIETLTATCVEASTPTYVGLS